MYIHLSLKPLLALMILIWIVIACNSQADSPLPPQNTPLSTPLSVTPAGQRVDLHAHRDGVFVLRQPQLLPESLSAPAQEFLWVGDGIDVDEFGRAELYFADLFSIEILRDGELKVQELSIDDSSGVVRASERLGTFLNDLPPQEKIKRRFTVESEYALITATGTKFLVVREAITPLEWVIALDAEPGDLEVTAKETGISKPLTTGQARWVAPLGEPSEVILYNEAELLAWLAAVQNGQPQPEVGDAPAVLWEPADVITNTQFITDELQLNSSFFVDGVKITLAEMADNSPSPTIYERKDCNSDGIPDIMMQNGTLLMDFRGVLARVRAVDVTLINYADSDQGSLSSFNPAYEALEQQSLTVGSNSIQILPLRSQSEPYHYAELTLIDGCFLGFSLTQPDQNDNPAQPRSVIDEPLPTATPIVTISPSATAEASPTLTATEAPIIIPTSTDTPTITATATETPTITATATETPTITATATETPIIIPRVAETPTMSPTAATETPTIILRAAETPTMSPTAATETPTIIPRVAETPTITATATETLTLNPRVTAEAPTINPRATAEAPTMTATITEIPPPR